MASRANTTRTNETSKASTSAKPKGFNTPVSLPPPAPSKLPPPSAPPKGANAQAGAEQGVIDLEVFGQLLEMDDDDQHDFSKPLAMEYIQQADETLNQIDKNLEDGKQSLADQLEFLSGRGHFLKGSSAALGLIKVRESCERLQNLGKCKDVNRDLEPEAALSEIRELLPQLKNEQAEATAWLKGLCAIE